MNNLTADGLVKLSSFADETPLGGPEDRKFLVAYNRFPRHVASSKFSSDDHSL